MSHPGSCRRSYYRPSRKDIDVRTTNGHMYSGDTYMKHVVQWQAIQYNQPAASDICSYDDDCRRSIGSARRRRGLCCASLQWQPHLFSILHSFCDPFWERGRLAMTHLLVSISLQLPKGRETAKQAWLRMMGHVTRHCRLFRIGKKKQRMHGISINGVRTHLFEWRSPYC
jgi:hypothetical protein